MRNSGIYYFILGSLFSCSTDSNNVEMKNAEQQTESKSYNYVAIAIHGGAGNLRKLNLSEQQELEYIAVLDSAIITGYKSLQDGSTAIEVAATTIRILENSPLFNAGKGAVFAADGKNYLDAAIMSGADLSAGAVAGVTRVKNPINLALAILNNSEHLMLSGTGAEAFALENNVELVDESYFYTEHRWQQLQNAIQEDRIELDHNAATSRYPNEPSEDKYGTVGCVVLDLNGNLAAATSTGGLTNKKFGRIGDSPLIGSGTYADNSTCAVSCTGKGEDFIRLAVAHEISSKVKHLKYGIQQAADSTILGELKSIKGRGGCIVIDTLGNIVFSFTTTGMFRAGIDKNGIKTIAIYE